MEKIFRITLLITGGINLLPAFLAFSTQKIADAYGIEIPNENYELLLRHRAVLFGIVGGLMIYSAVSKKQYTLSVTAGLTSMISFVILFFLMNEINLELEKVMKIDVAAIILLLVGFGLYKFRPTGK